MGKLLCLIFPMIMLFSACSAQPGMEEVFRQCQEQWAAGLETEVHLTVADMEADASLTWTNSEQSLVFHSPESMEGLSYRRTASGMDISMEGISAKVSAETLPQSAAVSELFRGLDGLAVAMENDSTLSAGDGQIHYEFNNLHLCIDRETAGLLRLEGEGLVAEFGDE